MLQDWISIPRYALPAYAVPQYALPFGVGEEVAAPSVPGIEFTATFDRLHFTIDASYRIHFTATEE